MPLHDYRCLKCGHLTEMLFSTSDSVLIATNCRKCGAAAKRIMGGFSPRFKGSGFYHTDYGRGRQCGGYNDMITELES